MNKTVLITGASSGIGKALAHQFAENGYDIVAVAEDEAALAGVVQKLNDEYPVEVTQISKNLVREDAPAEIYNQLKEKNIRIDVLVNNAGVGQKEKFHETDIEKDLEIVQLNIGALLRLTKLFVRDMVDRGEGKILNLGSVSGFQPGPLLAVYHASKAFVNSFSESIRDELEGTGVTVTVLCPGPTDTNFFDRADMENARILKDGIVMDPEKVARAGYNALMKEEHIVIPGMSNKILTFSRRLIPKSLQATINRKFYEVKQEEK